MHKHDVNEQRSRMHKHDDYNYEGSLTLRRDNRRYRSQWMFEKCFDSWDFLPSHLPPSQTLPKKMYVPKSVNGNTRKCLATFKLLCSSFQCVSRVCVTLTFAVRRSRWAREFPPINPRPSLKGVTEFMKYLSSVIWFLEIFNFQKPLKLSKVRPYTSIGPNILYIFQDIHKSGKSMLEIKIQIGREGQ